MTGLSDATEARTALRGARAETPARMPALGRRCARLPHGADAAARRAPGQASAVVGNPGAAASSAFASAPSHACLPNSRRASRGTSALGSRTAGCRTGDRPACRAAAPGGSTRRPHGARARQRMCARSRACSGARATASKRSPRRICPPASRTGAPGHASSGRIGSRGTSHAVHLLNPCAARTRTWGVRAGICGNSSCPEYTT
jgi:hypothetical protein